jgi:hypothetical protein
MNVVDDPQRVAGPGELASDYPNFNQERDQALADERMESDWYDHRYQGSLMDDCRAVVELAKSEQQEQHDLAVRRAQARLVEHYIRTHRCRNYVVDGHCLVCHKPIQSIQ